MFGFDERSTDFSAFCDHMMKYTFIKKIFKSSGSLISALMNWATDHCSHRQNIIDNIVKDESIANDHQLNVHFSSI